MLRVGLGKLSKALVAAAIALACAGVLVLLVQNSWNRPAAKPPVVARSTTTGQAAREAGAKLLPTDPKLAVEPKPAGPPPVQPANPR